MYVTLCMCDILVHLTMDTLHRQVHVPYIWYTEHRKRKLVRDMRVDISNHVYNSTQYIIITSQNRAGLPKFSACSIEKTWAGLGMRLVQIFFNHSSSNWHECGSESEMVQNGLFSLCDALPLLIVA